MDQLIFCPDLVCLVGVHGWGSIFCSFFFIIISKSGRTVAVRIITDIHTFSYGINISWYLLN